MLALAEALYPVWVTLFMGIFIGIAVWAFWPSKRQKDRMQDHANIPFRNDGAEGPRSIHGRMETSDRG
jgi:cbb3-type cytochrome oxidase subunit 3